MIGSSHSNGSGVLFLKAMGIAGLLFSWLAVLRPQMKVYWGRRGANRALMSQQSKVASAIAVTGWCLGVFGANQKLAVGLFLLGFVVAVIHSREDEKEHAARTGLPTRKRPTPQDYWLAFCLMDGVILSILTFALVRDHLYPPITDEAKSIHVMGIVLSVLLLVATVALYLNRPNKTSTGQQE